MEFGGHNTYYIQNGFDLGIHDTTKLLLKAAEKTRTKKPPSWLCRLRGLINPFLVGATGFEPATT